MQQQVLGHHLLWGHMGDAHQREYLVGATGGEQGLAQLQGVSGDDVVIGQTVDQQQRPRQ